MSGRGVRRAGRIGIAFGVAVLVAVLSAQVTHGGTTARQETREAAHRTDLPAAAETAALRRVPGFSLSEGLASTGSAAPDADRKELAEAAQQKPGNRCKPRPTG